MIALAATFEEKAVSPEVITPEAYAVLLECLLAGCMVFGKTEPVAAYLLREMRVLNDQDNQSSTVKVQPKYVVMDLKEWPNEYARSLAMQDIMVQYALETVGEKDINDPTFKGPGLWTAKKTAFEFDYVRREGKNTKGLPHHIYDPNPEAYRIALVVSEPVLIPTAWGKPYLVGSGGAVAVREKDVAKLAEALQDVKTGKLSIREALYNAANGEHYSRFDVYGMEPGFLELNYKPVEAKTATRQAVSSLSRSASCP